MNTIHIRATLPARKAIAFLLALFVVKKPNVMKTAQPIKAAAGFATADLNATFQRLLHK